MKASPLFLVFCLGAASAEAGPRFGGAHGAAPNNANAHRFAPFFVNAVSDIEPGPIPQGPPPPAPPPEPATFAPPPDPVYLPSPCVAPREPPLVRRLRPGPQILYLRKPSKRSGPLVIYGAG